MLSARRATAEDAEELARMAAELTAAGPGPWTARLAAFFRESLGTDRVAAFVIEREGGLASCASATITRSVPGPDHHGVYAHIHTVYTDPGHRRRGCARAAVTALTDWLAEQGATLITLNASDDGAPLYLSIGFTYNDRAMRRIRHPRPLDS